MQADNIPSASQMDIASSSTGSAKLMAYNNRRRLQKQEAIDILEGNDSMACSNAQLLTLDHHHHHHHYPCYTDFFQEVSQSPSIVEKEALLEKIKVTVQPIWMEIPGLMLTLSRQFQDVGTMIYFAWEVGLPAVVVDLD